MEVHKRYFTTGVIEFDPNLSSRENRKNAASRVASLFSQVAVFFERIGHGEFDDKIELPMRFVIEQEIGDISMRYTLTLTDSSGGGAI